MVARSHELFERSLAALVSAIEIYNKPNFLYREETFSILAINAWELLLKGKWLFNNSNNIRCLYKYQAKTKADGTVGKKMCIQKTRSGNPYTHGIDYIGKKLVENNELDATAWKNIQALLEIRDSAIHFYNLGESLSVRLQEIGAAAVRNYTILAKRWFKFDFSKCNLYLIPISIVRLPTENTIVLNAEERNLIKYIDEIEKESPFTTDSEFAFSVDLEVRFVKSKDKNAMDIRVTNNPNAPEVRLNEQQLSEKYPLNFAALINACKERYSDFKRTDQFYKRLNEIKASTKYAYRRNLYQENPNGPKTHYYSHAALNYLDNHYTKS
ncbi:MAG: DUF3644 domain-containing protein [Proteobacteria bacterium]|nr:DUF3644 domain-containing protein [Pseudomonadota bacterium]